MKFTVRKLKDGNFELTVNGVKEDIDFEGSRALTKTDGESNFGIFSIHSNPRGLEFRRWSDDDYMEVVVHLTPFATKNKTCAEIVEDIKSRVKAVNDAFAAKYPPVTDEATGDTEEGTPIFKPGGVFTPNPLMEASERLHSEFFAPLKPHTLCELRSSLDTIGDAMRSTQQPKKLYLVCAFIGDVNIETGSKAVDFLTARINLNERRESYIKSGFTVVFRGERVRSFSKDGVTVTIKIIEV